MNNQLKMIRYDYNLMLGRIELLENHCPEIAKLKDPEIGLILEDLPTPDMLKVFVACIEHDIDMTHILACDIEDYTDKYSFSICKRIDYELFGYMTEANDHATNLGNILRKISNAIESSESDGDDQS